MASMNTRLNIEKIDGNIIRKHEGSKQVGFKQLGLGVETGVHRVHDEKRVWFEVELQGAQRDRKAEVFQVSNDDTALAQRWLEDKQPEEKTNTDCLVKEQEKEYHTRWKIKTSNVLDSCNQRSTQQCMKSVVAKHLEVVGIQQQNGGCNQVYISSAQGYHHQRLDSRSLYIYWGRGFGWLASIKQGMLEPVKVKYIFLGYHKSIVGNKLWRFDEVTSKENIDQGAGLQEVQTQDLIDYQLARDREQHLASTVTRNAVTTAMAIIEATKGLLDKAKENVIGMETVKDQSDNTLRVSQSRSITRYGFMILGYAGSLKANLQHMEALSTTKAGYMTFTEVWKKKILLRGLLEELGVELNRVLRMP
nr:zinc finger, CCHC-type [Tanacetum cinerariifolium]